MKNQKLMMTRSNAILTMALILMGGAQQGRAASPAPAPGEERRWTLNVRTRLEQPGGARPVEVDLNGELISAISAVREGEYDAALRIENVRASSPTTNAGASESQQFERRLQRTFWATYLASGELVKVHFYKDMDASERNLLQMIATEIQFVRATKDQPAWTATERDGGGEYRATYRMVGPDVAIKQKVQYVRTAEASAKETGVQIVIDQSESRFMLDSSGIVALDASIRLHIVSAAGSKQSGYLGMMTETHLSDLRRSEARELIGSLARASKDVETSLVKTQESDPVQLRARLDTQLLEGRSAESILMLAAGGADQMANQRLAALFRQRSEAPAMALDLLRRGGPQKRITDALGAAGSASATATLGLIAGDRSLSRGLRVDALTAFLQNHEPSDAAMRIPMALLDDPDRTVASAARIVSGALARAGRGEHPAQAERIDAALVRRYQTAQTMEERIDVLGAMGNSTGASVTPLIEAALADPQAPVRSAALRALRLVPGSSVDSRLAAAIASDRDPEVRIAAVFATGFRNPIDPKLIGGLVTAAKADPAEQVRANAITLLRQHPERVPGLADTLRWIAAHDPKQGVRELAERALKSL